VTYRRVARMMAIAAPAVAIVTASSGIAWAHECFVANRSSQGNAAVAAHSAAWTTVTPEMIFGDFIGLQGDAYTCAVAAWKSNPDLPSYLVVGGKQAVGQGGVIAENNPNFATGKASDGSGIDHAEDVFGPAIGQILAACT
jgi:hypothetical protein